MWTRGSTWGGAALAALIGVVLLAAQQAAAQQARRPASATAQPHAACYTGAEPQAIATSCDAVLANRAAFTADQIGLALQRRGVARAALGQIAEATDDFRQMIQANHKPHEAHASIASLQVREGKLADAESSYRAALRLNPSYSHALNGLGNTLIALGRAREAVPHFDQALTTAESDINAHFGKGLALHASGDLDGAIRSLGDALRLDPRLLPALYQRAQAHADKAALVPALADADSAVAIAEGEERVRALSLRGRLRIAAKNLEGAATDCTEATALADRINVKDAPLRAAAYTCLAQADQNRGRLTEAQQSYDRALQWSPDDASTLAGRGYVFLQKGRFDQALADFSAALKVDPRSQDALRFLGLTYADKGDNSRAMDTFARAIEADPKDPWPLMLRAITIAKTGDRERALKDVENAIRLTGPQSSDAVLVRGAVRYFLEDLAAARADFDSAIRLNGDNAQAYRLLGRLLIRTGRLDEAARALETAGRLLPGDPTVLLNRGLLAYARRDHATAVRELTQSLAINSAHAEGFAVRGQAYEALGRTELAISDYRAAETKLATDADGKRAQDVARERLAALTRPPTPAALQTNPPPPRPAGLPSETGTIKAARPAASPPEIVAVPRRDPSGAPQEPASQPPRPPDAQPPSAYCRVVEGIFSHSRRYTGVNFDLGCRPDT